MNKIKRIEIDGDRIAMKKSSLGWRVVYPYKNEDGSINWFNILTGGSWANVITVTIIVIMILGVLYEYSININNLLSCFDNLQALEVCKQSLMPSYHQINLP